MTQVLLQERQPSELSLYIIREVARQYREFKSKRKNNLFAFDASLIKVTDVHLAIKKIAGVRVPQLDNVDFEIQPYTFLQRRR